jgi:hypothetical protein
VPTSPVAPTTATRMVIGFYFLKFIFYFIDANKKAFPVKEGF